MNFFMKNYIGREAETRVLNDALETNEPELIAVFGRRRVGKTFLIRQVYAKQTIFEFSGVKDTTTVRQLE
jgi:uncharacterized protein